jgi:hypothetical protein
MNRLQVRLKINDRNPPVKSRTKLSAIIFSCLALASTALAQQIQSFDLVWSGDTPFLRSLGDQSVLSGNLGADLLGCPYVSSATATGQIQVDMSQVQPGAEAIPASAIVGFTMVVSGAGSGNGTFSSQDFQSLSIDLGGASFDFTRELVGQILPNGVPFAGMQDISTVAPGGDFSLSAVTDGLAPCSSAFPYVVVTGGSDPSGCAYLQLVSFKPSP